ADRTVMPATVGWALLVGAAPWGGRGWLRALGLFGVAAILLLSSLSVAAIYRGATKQQYRALAEATALAATFGLPIVTDDEITEALIDAYAPQALRERHISADDRDWSAPLAAPDGAPSAVWFAYAEYPWDEADLNGTRERIAAGGYE